MSHLYIAALFEFFLFLLEDGRWEVIIKVLRTTETLLHRPHRDKMGYCELSESFKFNDDAHFKGKSTLLPKCIKSPISKYIYLTKNIISYSLYLKTIFSSIVFYIYWQHWRISSQCENVIWIHQMALPSLLSVWSWYYSIEIFSFGWSLYYDNKHLIVIFHWNSELCIKNQSFIGKTITSYPQKLRLMRHAQSQQ